jgi:hypothetical protein
VAQSRNQAANGGNKHQPGVSEETDLLDSNKNPTFYEGFIFVHDSNTSRGCRMKHRINQVSSRASDILRYVFITAIFFLLILSFTPHIAVANNLDNWYLRSTYQGISSVAYGNNKFVAVGPGSIQSSVLGQPGLIMTSTDGINWIKRNSATGATLHSIIRANNLFVAVGGNGPNNSSVIETSSDGISWHQRTVDTVWTSSLLSVAYGNNTFVAVGEPTYFGTTEGLIFTSADAITWTRQTIATGGHLQGVTYGNSKFVAVSSNGGIFTSTNGASWVNQINASVSFRDVAYALNTFVAVGSSGTILTSPDGRVWTSTYAVTTEVLNRIFFANNIFIALGMHGAILTSQDGKIWVNRSTDVNRVNLYGGAYGNGIFVATGADGTVLTSQNSLSWVRRLANAAQDEGVYNIDCLNNNFYIVGSGIYRSPDGKSWEKHPESCFTQVSPPKDIAYGNNKYVGVRYYATATSSDSLSWKCKNNQIFLNRITYGKNIFVAVGDSGRIVTSTDGENWDYNIRSGTTFGLFGIAYGNDRFVAVGGGGILTSLDGQQWTTTFESSIRLSNVAYGKGMFVAVGYGLIFTSTDGYTWTMRNSPATELFTGIAYSGNHFVISGDEGSILTSPDGINWEIVLNGTGPSLEGIAYCNNTFVSAANWGFILQSDSDCTYAISPNTERFSRSNAQGIITVTPSSSSCFWTATSNTSWVTITSGTSGNGNGTVSYSVAANTGGFRTGTLTIGGQTFTVNQSGNSLPWLLLLLGQ